MFWFRDISKTKLVSLTLHENKNDCPRYYLQAVYEVEDERGLHKLTIPRIALPVTNGGPTITIESGHFGDEVATIDIGFGEVLLYKHEGAYAVTELLEEKVHDMTVEDIEKKLGYKVRVVSDNKKE